MEKQGTIQIVAVFDEKGIPHMHLDSEFDPELTIKTLESLIQLLKNNNSLFLSSPYLSTPYLN